MDLTSDALKKTLGNLQKALESIGFSSKEAAHQILSLGELVSISVYGRTIREYPEVASATETKQLEQFISQHQDNEGLEKFFSDEATRIISGYLKEITKNLSAQQQEAFFATLQKQI